MGKAPSLAGGTATSQIEGLEGQGSVLLPFFFFLFGLKGLVKVASFLCVSCVQELSILQVGG